MIKISLKDLHPRNQERFKVPSFIRDILSPNRIWLAGGALRAMFDGTKIADYDIYMATTADFAFLEDYFGNLTKNVIRHSDEMITFIYGKHRIQLIGFKTPKSPQDIFDEFDFSVCCLAYDGKSLFINNKKTLRDIKKKTIGTINLPKDWQTNPLGVIRRFEKYRKNGYHISYDCYFTFLRKLTDTFSPEHFDFMHESMKKYRGKNIGDDIEDELLDEDEYQAKKRQEEKTAAFEPNTESDAVTVENILKNLVDPS